jgi:hypothetical protein
MQYMTTQQRNYISGAPLMPSHFLNVDKFGIEIDVRESDDSTLNKGKRRLQVHRSITLQFSSKQNHAAGPNAIIFSTTQ